MEKVNYAVSVVCVSIAAVLSTQVIVFAQEQDSRSPQATIPQNLREKAKVDEEWEKAADTNKDGIVDGVEIKQWRRRGKENNSSESSISQESIADSSTTATSSGSNMSISENAQADRRWEKIADVNQDGVVDQTEFKQWNQQGNNPPGQVGGPGQSPGQGGVGQNKNIQSNSQVDRPWEKRADDNKDGRVDSKEFKQWNQQGNNPPGQVGGPGQSPRQSSGGGHGGARGNK